MIKGMLSPWKGSCISNLQLSNMPCRLVGDHRKTPDGSKTSTDCGDARSFNMIIVTILISASLPLAVVLDADIASTMQRMIAANFGVRKGFAIGKRTVGGYFKG